MPASQHAQYLQPATGSSMHAVPMVLVVSEPLPLQPIDARLVQA